ncbi:MAG: UDP-glucose/GDP-mannose dehydrogenase family protein [Nanoarchaeota archaeon]
MKLSILGSGYVGLTTGICLASLGHEVIFSDIDKKKLENLKQGIIPIYEPGLEELYKANKENISFAEDTKTLLAQSNMIFICVGTPSQEDGSIDLTYVEQACKDLGRALQDAKEYPVLIIKSTVVPGTTDKMRPIIEAASGKKAGEDFGLVMNPEFLREGIAVEDFLKPDRIVVGAAHEKEKTKIHDLYRGSFPDVDIFTTNPSTAEMIKYTSNCFFATCISFSNEVSNICEAFGNIKQRDVLYGLTLDKRIKPIIDGKRLTPGVVSFLAAGCGYGGSCFPKDVNAIISHASKQGYVPHLLKDVAAINTKQMLFIVDKTEQTAGNLDGRRIAILGLAFKPDTDDIRESAAITLINILKKKACELHVHDPKAMDNVRETFKDTLNYHENPQDTVKDADICFVVTSWKEYLILPESFFLEHMKTPVVVDCRGVYKDMKEVTYVNVGSPTDEKL